ncbi:MAG TPA: MmcQ/YjbR family DNA-binding protein [Actinomycetes bacterium]|nr:MmcQ/YjbR family DNA-binding protein [Actinomycetes bacterium]
MTLDELIDYCMRKPGAVESYPWGDDELVPKVGGKAFAFIDMAGHAVSLRASSVNVAHEWQARYPDDIQPSAYIGRHGWNRVLLRGRVPDSELHELIDMSYETVLSRLARAKRPG